MNLRPALHCLCGLAAILICPWLTAAPGDLPPTGTPDVLLTNALSWRSLVSDSHVLNAVLRLEGTVLWAGPERGELFLQDESGAIRIQCDLHNQPAMQPGDRVRVVGHAIASSTGLRQNLIDNDGLHGPTEISQAVYLSAGQHPLCVQWFNGPAGFELALEYEGPSVPRQKIPDWVLFRDSSGAVPNQPKLAPGLDYQCFEGNFQWLPDFAQLAPVKSGTVTNLDLAARSRDQNVALQFNGYLDIPSAGLYTFWLKSDDGSRLFLGRWALKITNLGPGSLPVPRRVLAGQLLRRDDEYCWADAEGTLLALDPEPGGGMEAEIGLGTNRLRLDVADSSGAAPPLFSSIRASGICLSRSDSSARVAGRLLVPGFNHLEVLKSPPQNLLPSHSATLAQLRTLTTAGQCAPGATEVQGVVFTADPGAGLVTVADASGVALAGLDLRGWNLRPGHRISVAGYCLVEGSRFRFGPLPLVDNDGVHTVAEKSAAIFLSAGKHPVRLGWFNRDRPAALEVYWQGPGLPREPIPATVLFHPELSRNNDAIEWAPGLRYQAYEGRWLRTPNALMLEPVRQGLATNFDISLTTRPQGVALVFSGFLEAPRDGIYNFSTVADDGCLLYVDAQPTALRVLGEGSSPAPVTIAPHQLLHPDDQFRWSEVEGLVTYAGQQGGSLALELSAGTGRLRVEVANPAGTSPMLLLNSRIRATGICQADYTPDGRTVAGTLVTPSLKELEIVELAPAHWADYPVVPIARLPETTVREDSETVVHVRGKVSGVAEDGSLILEDESGLVRLQTAQPPPESDSLEIEALGRLCRDGTNSVLRCAIYRESAGPTDQSSTPLPVLTTIEQVKRLNRRDAQRGYPVKIRAVVTTALTAGCFMQDATMAIYVRWQNTVKGDFPRVGEYWEVEGVTFAEFAPNIFARRAVKLGTGVLPEPLRPTWDQLINGSLDIRYVEIQGVVIGVDSDGLALLTRDGRIKVQLSELSPQTLKLYQNALIRLRGCLVPEKAVSGHKVELGRIGLSNCSVTVDEPAPADPFALPLKRLGELLLFDPRASSIQRVKLSGQVLHERRGEYFLMEGDAGLRFLLRGHGDFGPGDLVEVVGFPDLSGPSPVLREALARRVGHAVLPAPQALPVTNLLSRRFDATLVRVEANLANISLNRGSQVFELQAGGRGFVARLESRRGLLGGLAPGTRLELTGVYAGQGGDVAAGRDIDSFELLLNAPADLRILQRPSWWTGRHALTVLGVMAFIILVALVWINLLRRQVEERSLMLATEVRRHEQTERQRALEQERTRISRDLHDDLGATLTQIRLLSALESRDNLVPPTSRSRMGQVSEKSRQMVASLDEIVWAVNPANDSLPSLATYLCQFAEEFFRPTSIRCRLDVADQLLPVPLTSEVRHNLYLVVREALNNIAKHSEATEVWLRIQSPDHTLRIDLEDNGRGFSFPAEAFAGEGLGNMRQRLERIGGHFECQTQSGTGTVCRIWLPLTPPAGA